MSTDASRDEHAILAELTPIFREVFEDEHLVIDLQTTAKDVADWDSLTHMQLIVVVEERYGMKFKLSDVVKFKNVGDMCRAILKAGH